MQKWNQFAAAPTQYKPLTTEHREDIGTKVAFGTHKPRWIQYHESTNHPGYGLASHETEVYKVTEVSRCTQQGEIPRTDAFATFSVAFEQLTCTIANLAMDKLGVAARMVDLIFLHQ